MKALNLIIFLNLLFTKLDVNLQNKIIDMI